MRQLSIAVFLIFIFISNLLSSCTTQSTKMILIWIDAPYEDVIYLPGEPIEIVSHTFGKNGVAEIMLYIDGEPIQKAAVQGQANEFLLSTQQWTPAETGVFTVQVYALDINGEKSLPATVSIRVDDPPTPAFTATDIFTDTPVISNTPLPTSTPTKTATIYVPPVPTNTFTIHPSVTAKPVDNQGPPAPTHASPDNHAELGCRASQTLSWNPVNDPSGIDGYYVKVEKVGGDGNWQSVGGFGPISGTSLDINLDCGIKYRWMVRARDGAGNFGDWSKSTEFIIILG